MRKLKTNYFRNVLIIVVRWRRDIEGELTQVGSSELVRVIELRVVVLLEVFYFVVHVKFEFKMLKKALEILSEFLLVRNKSFYLNKFSLDFNFVAFYNFCLRFRNFG